MNNMIIDRRLQRLSVMYEKRSRKSGKSMLFA